MTETVPQSCLFGYARISTYGQTFDAWLDQLRAEGCAKFYRGNASGTQADWRELQHMPESLVFLRRGNGVADKLYSAWPTI